jgi:probable HAF family extracellular repeat protein
MAKNIVFTAIAALIPCHLLATAHAGPPLYTVTDLGTFGGTNSGGLGINASGQVTGYATFPGETVHHAFIYSDGSLRDLGALGAATNSSVANGINSTRKKPRSGRMRSPLIRPTASPLCLISPASRTMCWSRRKIIPAPT